MSAHVGEYRRWIAWVLALVSAIEVSVLALRVVGVDARLWAGPFLVSIHSVYKPLWVALGAAAGLLVVAPDTGAWRAGHSPACSRRRPRAAGGHREARDGVAG